MCNQSRTCNNTEKNNHMCVTYVGINTRITYQQYIRTRAKKYLETFYALSETIKHNACTVGTPEKCQSPHVPESLATR